MASTLHPIDELTVREWIALANSEGWSRVELEDGRVVELTPIHGLHAATVSRVMHLLSTELGVGRVGPFTVELDAHTGYDPDVVVLRAGTEVQDLGPIPAAGCALVIEVAVSSAPRDLGRKVERYGRAGIPEYWVIRPEPDLGVLLRHREPHDNGYAVVDSYAVGHRAEPLDVGAVLSAP